MAIALVFPAFAAHADAVVIAALGDSLTAGYGLEDGQGLVPQLQGWLDAEGVGATLQNAGVSGDTSAGGLARLGWTLGPDVDALIVELGANDMLRGVDPAEVRRNLDAILAQAGEAGLPVLLLGFSAPGNYGPDYQQEFDAIFPELAAAHGADLFPSYFAPLRNADDGSPAARARLMQGDGLHPTAEGVALIVAALGPQVKALAERAAE
ncbi:arylesterase [Poseidonocella sp. HB161398]|uniref:arylesterase n=1 Tax=Poseidonocella sp. HB161398 TaxID=2320855 RepID=UPI001F10A60D|nr:arylesterase [Poseidonocella sp. HB161398]